MANRIAKLLKIELFPNIRQRMEIVSDLSIGRDSDNQIILKDMSSSSQHAMVGIDGDRVWIEDLGSTNGTHVNDSMIHKKYLEDKDLITIGYTKIWFSCEEEPSEWKNFSLEEDLCDKEECAVLLPLKEETMRKWSGWLLERFTVLGISDFSKAVLAALENAYIHGNSRNRNNVLRCYIKKTITQVMVTIQDQGPGFDYENKLKTIFTQASPNQNKLSGLEIILHESDSIEFNKIGNQIVLFKNLKNVSDRSKESTTTIPIPDRAATNRKKMFNSIRYFSLRYFQYAIYKKTSPIKILISGQPLRIFPENLEIKPLSGQNFSSTTLVTIQPVCPGCLVNPSSQEIDISQTPNKIEFWITPLTLERYSLQSLIHIIKEGTVVQTIKIPFIIMNSYLARQFLWASLWLPIVMILLDIPNFPLNRDMPLLVLWLLRAVQSLGGWSVCGILLGCISLGISLFLHWRNRPIPSEVIHSEANIG